MLETIKKIWNIFNTLVIILAVLLALLLVGVRLLGFEIYTVLSGSMEPSYKTGSLIYVQKNVDPAELQVGDPVTFRLPGGMPATHRIVEVLPDEEDPTGICFRTKGDANEQADPALLSPADVLGRPLFSIPCLGYLVRYVQSPPGSYVAMVAAAFFLLLLILPDYIFGSRKED